MLAGILEEYRDVNMQIKGQVPGKCFVKRLSGRSLLLVQFLLFSVILAGCGAAAAPCRVASAGIKIIPVVGGVASAPTDACADVVDP